MSQANLTSPAGVTMPAMLYGTAWKKNTTSDLVVTAVQTGFRGIDTACQPKHYNEAQVGEALVRLNRQGIERESLFLQTKFTPLSAQDPKQIPYDRHASVADQVAQSFQVSKKNLQTDYIDSLILHSPITPDDQLMQAWHAMEACCQSAEAGQLGISNCYELSVLKLLYQRAEIKPAVLQNRFYKDTGYDVAIRDWCAEKGIIYQSFWTLTANPHILSSDTVKVIAETNQKTPAQVFFRYLNQSGIVPLTGTTSEQHMQEDLSIFEFELTAEELMAIKLKLL